MEGLGAQKSKQEVTKVVATVIRAVAGQCSLPESHFASKYKFF